MIWTIISEIPCMTVHMLHGKSRSVLDFQQRLLTGERKLYVCAGLNRAQANTSSMFGIIEDTRIRIMGNRAVGSKKGQGLNHGRHLTGVVGVDSGTCECQMSFSSDDWAKHNLNSSMGRSCNSTPSSKCFTISKASTPVSVDGPSVKVIASFTCYGTNIGEVWISCFGPSTNSPVRNAQRKKQQVSQ